MGKASFFRPTRMLGIMLLVLLSANSAVLAGSPVKASPVLTRPALELWLVTGEVAAVENLEPALRREGGRIIAHLAQDKWLVAGEAAVLASVSGLHSTRRWRPADGVSDELRRLAAEPKGLGPGVVYLAAALAPGHEVGPVVAVLEAVEASLSWLDESADPIPQLGLRVSRDHLAAVVEELEATQGLVWAEPYAPVRLLNDASAWRCQSGQENSTPFYDRGLFGDGQVIGIMDTGIDIDECRFDDPVAGLPALNRTDGTEVNLEHRKVLAVDFHWDADWPPGPTDWDDQGHGTHVAGSAAGDVRGNGTYDGVDGMAPAAKLVIQDGGARIDDCADLPGLGCPVKPLGPVLEQAWIQGARIHTNSWGDEENYLPYGRYTERTADVDRFMWQHKDMLVFFAAGNSGPGFDTLGSPSTGKNVVAVGATLHGDFQPPCVVDFSSRGWTHDGRIKPDVLAPGTSVVSPATNGIVPAPSCSNTTKSGTSMASPTAAGLGALVREYFSDGIYPSGSPRPDDGFQPTAALVKAVLIASAVDLNALGCPAEPVPSRDQGWGLIQLDTALAFSGDDHRILVDDHKTGFVTPDDEPVRMTIVAGEPGPLKVVLVWTDAPSSSLAETNLLNDLDLSVSGPDGEFKGNVFSGGESIPGGSFDRINNVEVVYLPNAGTGMWTIEVDPQVVPVPSQDYALVVTVAVRPNQGPRQPSGRVAP